MYLAVSVLSFLLLVVALVDIITRDEWQVQHLPKIVWILLVVFLPFVGSVIWFAVGRQHSPRVERGGFGDPRRRPQAETSHTDFAAVRTKTTEQELEDLDREIEYYEKQAQLKRLQAEVDEKRDMTE